MDETLPPDLITPAIPAFVVMMLVELAWLARHRESPQGPFVGYTLKDSAASITMGLGYSAIGLLWKGAAYGLYLAAYKLTPLRLGSGPWVWVLLFFADDFCYYWFHRLHHECRLLWASHVVHHSSQHYNLTTAVRQTWTPMTAVFFWLPLPLLGFHPAMVMVAQSINLLYQFWIHTEAVGRLGVLEWVLNTPSHHRVHHAINPQYLDKNYGGILIVWDRLFGTFTPEAERPRYGITKQLTTYNPLRIAFYEYGAIVRDALKPNPWRTRLGYIFRGPGWKPEPEPARAVPQASAPAPSP